MSGALPYMQFYVADYLADTFDLTTEEHGIYLLLLMLSWRRKGTLPNDAVYLRKALGSCAVKLHGNHFNRIVPALLDRFFFIDSDGNWANKRLGKELELARKRSGTAQENAGKRWAKTNKNNSLDNAPAMLSDTDKIRTDKNKEPNGSLSEASSDEGDLREAVDAYNATAQLLGLPQCQKLSARRKSALKARLRDAGGISGWATALEKLADSPYCRGEVNGWRADIDFLLQEKSFTKLMEGSYAKRTGANGRSVVHRENSIADGLEAARTVIEEQRRREREGA